MSKTVDKVAVMTDSVACLPPEIAEKYKIIIVPAGNIYFEGKTYRDWIDLSYSEAYHILEKSPEEFFTGPTSPAEFMQVYKRLAENYSSILYVSLSSKLSTLHNVAKLARDMVAEEIADTRIEIVDSYTATAAEGFIAMAAAKAALDGRNLEEVISIAKKIRQKVDLFYILYTVKYVYRTGRVTRSMADFGSKLNVKPIITIKKGAAQVKGFVRNSGRGIESLLRLARQQIKNSRVHMAILHADAMEDAEVLREKISGEFECVELWIGEFSPLMVYATGKGVIGIAFYAEDN